MVSLNMHKVVGLKRRNSNYISRKRNVASDDGSMFIGRVRGRGSAGTFKQDFYSDKC